MKPSDDLVEYMKWWEAGPEGNGKPALRAYQDPVGVWTIGYGYTRGVQPYWIWQAGQAEENLRTELAEVAASVEQSLNGYELAQHQWDALTSFVYNIGLPKFRTSSPRIMIQQGLLQRVGPCMELWNKGNVGGTLVELKGLTKRRAADRAIWDKADYSGRP